ncbi:natural resistance-associated macrophage protein-domain-containing protein [Butyriboletus roseoflavus]|nr:natural resistance-associated macrophage protein-domain-containing protein [Butyriboletus roseoflavus]
MSVAVVPTEAEASQPTRRTGWSIKLDRVGWRLYHHATKHTGVGIVCSVAYFDPGNWVTDLQAWLSVWVQLIVHCSPRWHHCQLLADLASHCRLLFHDRPRHKLLWRWGVLYPLYLLAELAIVCTDLAEMLGSAIALVLLFPALPLWFTILLTATDVMLILAIENPLKSRPVKLFEGLIAALVLATLICIAIILSKVTINWGDAFRGFVPSKELFASGFSIYLLFLGSHLATQDRLAKDSERELPKISQTPSPHQMTLSQRMLGSIRHLFSWRRLFSISRSDETSYPPSVKTHADRENNKLGFIKSHIYHGMVDVAASLMSVAVIINSLILIISSAVFYYNSGAYGNESPASLFDAHSLIKNSIGNGAALLFALALLASGQSASIVAIVAGQSVSEGFLRWKVSPTLRRLITRVLGLIPSVIVASVIGENGINTLLVATQVVLSIILPFIIIPLLYLTSSSRIMSVKSRRSESASPTQIPPGPPSLHAIDHIDASRDKEADSEDEVVDFSSGKIVMAIGYVMWLIIVAANVYALATL